MADVVDGFSDSRSVRQVGQDGQIIAALGLSQQSADTAGAILRRPNPLGQILLQSPVGHILGALHIRLVKGMQVQQAAGNGGGIFPPIELRAQIVAVGQIQARYRMAGGGDRFHPGIQSGVVIRRQAQIDKEPVAAIVLRRQRRLAGNRNNAGALFAQALGQHLLDPQAEPGNPGRGNQSQFIPALAGQDTHRRAQPSPGIGGGGVNIAAFFHPGGAAQQLAQIHADQSRRDQSETGQYRIAAAHFRGIEKDLPKALFPAQLFQHGARISDGGEVCSGGRAFDGGDPLPEMGIKAVGFNGGAGFGGDQKEGLGRVNDLFHRLHPGGQGGIQQQQLGVARLTAAGPPQHFRPQAAAAHPQQNDMAIAISPHAIGKGGQFGNPSLHFVDDGHPAQPVDNFRGVVAPDPVIAFPDAGNYPVGVQAGQGCRYRRRIVPQKFRPLLPLWHGPSPSCECAGGRQAGNRYAAPRPVVMATQNRLTG